MNRNSIGIARQVLCSIKYTKTVPRDLHPRILASVYSAHARSHLSSDVESAAGCRLFGRNSWRLYDD